ncbi:hypothetical protein [Psychroflexus sp. MES1-P1E]|uniref:hypothetical protein n=1 Tax=Psychroflexus sp. MES1-P1E TaxID=2058320 RepID=UPI000C7CC801|nr:hypothetical protein [Psychroflexus sp. MES1-P1E]PKG42769.1 hypothetical protein CXF67_08515 [Psychroflexus sp. MES1-P1E]
MKKEFNELKNNWESNKIEIELSDDSLAVLYGKIKEKEIENYFFYCSTITILTTILIVMSLFFLYVAPVKELLSRIGAGLMIFGLVFRISIEIVSIYKAKLIKTLDSTLKATETSLIFYQFRKTVHKVIAPVIVGLYTIGFYMITPKFSLYIEFLNLVLIDVSYIIIGVIIFIFIKIGVKKEMQKLTDIIEFKNDISE